MNYSDLLKFHRENKSNITVAGKKENFQIPFGVLKKTKDKFVNIEEKPSISFFINTGIYILDKKIIKK